MFYDDPKQRRLQQKNTIHTPITDPEGSRKRENNTKEMNELKFNIREVELITPIEQGERWNCHNLIRECSAAKSHYNIPPKNLKV